MDYYKIYVRVLNKYKSIAITITDDWKESITPLKRCYDELAALDAVQLDADAERKKTELNTFAEHGDYLCKLDFLEKINDIFRVLEECRERDTEEAKRRQKSGAWTWEELTTWLSTYGNITELWRRHAQELADNLGIIDTPKNYPVEITQLFASVEDCIKFFDLKGANNMNCAQWARRAAEYKDKELLFFVMKGDIITLYNEIKRQHKSIAEYSDFTETLRKLEKKKEPPKKHEKFV